jgi:hypothetical protein
MKELFDFLQISKNRHHKSDTSVWIITKCMQELVFTNKAQYKKTIDLTLD